MYAAGEIHDLTGVPGYDSKGKQITLDGRYELVEFLPREPSNYVQTDCWNILHENSFPDEGDENWEDYIESVDDDALIKHLCPDQWAKIMEQERMMAE